MLTECPGAGSHPSPQPDGKHLNGTSTQQSSLVLSRFNLAGLGHFLGLFLQEKEQLSCWECWAVVIVHGWAVSGQCIHFILVHLPGDTLSPLVSSITCLLLPFKKKNSAGFHFPFTMFLHNKWNKFIAYSCWVNLSCWWLTKTSQDPA